MGSVENIVIAKRTGVCYGVREAIDKAKIARASGKEQPRAPGALTHERIDHCYVGRVSPDAHP